MLLTYKKLLASLFFVFSIMTILAQNQKSEEILSRPFEKEILNANFTFSDSNQIEGIDIHFYTVISGANQSKKNVTLFSGSPVEFYSFLNQVDSFIVENLPETSTVLYGQKVILLDIGIPKSARIYGKDDLKYSKIYSADEISVIRRRFIDWAKNQDIRLD